ncbi:MAG TPA: CaiB/BaiF CoA-transferase family protein [Actinomycetota bacterium]|nr:CaiB/BaiF CoA-transferase family protein [Actinomycetota bacterium]
MTDEQLSGISVLDLSSVGPGSRCTALLADLGADVVKVGAPEGRIEPPFFSYSAGRGTRRIAIDLRKPEGRDVFLRLARGADVIVESYRPGVADRLGVGYADASKVNERVVYCAITGYGQDGPYASWAGHDLNYLAVGGFLATQGRRADGGPAIPGATVADSAGGGMQAVIAILAAVLRRTVTNTGQYLDVSTTEGVLSLTSLYVDELLATGNETRPGSNLLTGAFACYDLYRARDDRWLAVAAIEPKFFANLCRLLESERWIPHQMDPARQADIRDAFAASFATRDAAEWVTLLGPADTCVAPVLTIGEVAQDPHLRARGLFAEAEHPERGRVPQLASVIAGSERRDTYVAGSDASNEILQNAGMTAEEIEELRAQGVVV